VHSHSRPFFIVPRVLAARGFSLPELIAVIVITSILAAIALPRLFSRGAFDTVGFSNQAQAAVKLAQKLAIAQGRWMHVSIAGNTVTIFRTAANTNCAGGTVIPFPSGTLTSAPTGVTLAASAPEFCFDAQGRPIAIDTATPASATNTLTISGTDGTRTFFIEPQTGYVH
jgi:MSHA pilin protein MshC